jgi:23S rRNA (adenine2503-C2)-methyltransferase
MPEVTALTPSALGMLMPSAAGRPSVARGKGVWRWLRDGGVPTQWPVALPEAGKGALRQLRESARLPSLQVLDVVRSRDGTVKWRVQCHGLPVETVLIPHEARSTACISSQSGCTRDCDFCATAQMGFGGNLTAGEMVAQVLLARAHAPPLAPLTNVVLMGMGEPLDNLPNVLSMLQVLEEGLLLGPRHVTVSTSGVLPKLREFLASSRACVALSLHATTDPLRSALMPRVARWSLAELVALLREESQRTSRHFFIEYILLKDVNDTAEDAARLVEWMKGVRARVNLIPFNPSPGIRYGRPSQDTVRRFQAQVMQGGLLCLTRETRGDDTSAACGQLTVLSSAARDGRSNERPLMEHS